MSTVKFPVKIIFIVATVIQTLAVVLLIFVIVRRWRKVKEEIRVEVMKERRIRNALEGKDLNKLH